MIRKRRNSTMTKAGEREVVKVERVNGGAGFIMKEGLLSQEELGEHCKMFSRVTVPANCELGHHGDRDVLHP